MVIENPAKVLETRAEEVINFDESFRKLTTDMIETMNSSRGIGLAANQVGVLQRVLVINIPYNIDHISIWKNRDDCIFIKYKIQSYIINIS